MVRAVEVWLLEQLHEGLYSRGVHVQKAAHAGVFKCTHRLPWLKLMSVWYGGASGDGGIDGGAVGAAANFGQVTDVVTL